MIVHNHIQIHMLFLIEIKYILVKNIQMSYRNYIFSSNYVVPPTVVLKI